MNAVLQCTLLQRTIGAIPLRMRGKGTPPPLVEVRGEVYLPLAD